MIEFLADLLLPLKAVEEQRVRFHLRMRNFDGDGAVVIDIGRAVDRGHAAARDQTVDAVVIEQITGMKGGHELGLES